jgi:hypothetical protein
VENRVALPANFTFFNALLLFAQFQCNDFFCTAAFSERQSECEGQST